MKKIVHTFASLFWLLAVACHANADTLPRNVLAHSSGQWSWYAHVIRVPNVVPTDTSGSNEQTECFALQNAPGQPWKALATVPGRAIGLAARSSQLALLMSDGTWLTLWEDGSASGQALPAGGHIKTIADDGNHLWAIGSVSGGMSAANAAITMDAATTQPTTALLDIQPPASTAPAELPVARSVPAKMVVFEEQNGRWATVTEMPPDAMLSDDAEMSLVVIGDAPLISFKSAGGVLRTLEYTSQHQWQDVIKPIDNQSVANFRILSDGFNPLFWFTGGNDPGELIATGPNHASSIKLPWGGGPQLDGLPTAMFSGGYLCVLGPHAGKVLEQRYKLDGTTVGTADELTVVDDVDQSLLPRWLEVVFLSSMGFSVGASVFRQWSEPTKRPVIKSPVAAELLPRLAAGLLDALPVIGALFFIGVKTNALDDIDNMPAIQMAIILGSAMFLYVLHTTLVETLTGRSAGKWAFGLKVVTLDGAAATRSQLLIRNLLRVIDPLVMIIISPQRQRSADAVAGTMVVPLVPLPELPEDPGDQD